MAANSAPQTFFSSHPRHSTQVLMSAPSEGGCATPASNGWAPFRPAPAPSYGTKSVWLGCWSAHLQCRRRRHHLAAVAEAPALRC
jgi:hypothetical protein